MRYAYLQFDGIGNDANSHRQVGNLFDVKLRAIENMHEAGIEIVLVTTIVNNVNNDQVGPIVKFAMENPKKIAFVSFQPVSFTGRDEDITPERRIRQRYTLSHLAQDVSEQVGKIEPTRDWFPLSFISPFAGFADLVHGPDAQWGSLSCGCHPNCGVGTAMMINKETKEWAPISRFLNAPQLVKDVSAITDAARGKKFSAFMMALALLKNYDAVPGAAEPAAEGHLEEVRQDLGRLEGLGQEIRPHQPEAHLRRRHEAPRRRSVEHALHRRHVVPGSLQLRFPPHRNVHHPLRHAAGRNFLLRVQHRRRLAEDHREHAQECDRRAVVQEARQARNLRQGQEGRPRRTTSTRCKIDAEDASRVRHLEHDIPLTAAEEDRIRRKKAFEEAAKVRKIYEELVLKKPQETVVQIGSIQQIQMAVPGATVKPVQIAPANGNGNAHAETPAANPSPATNSTFTLVGFSNSPGSGRGCCFL